MRNQRRHVARLRLALLTVLAAFVVAGVGASPGAGATIPCSTVQPTVTNCSVTVTTTQISATFTVTQGSIQISLGSYTKPGPANAVVFPQQLFASQTGVFGPGTHTLTAALPTCGPFQFELVVGGLPQTLTGRLPASVLLVGRLGSGPACVGAPRTLGFYKNHASCSQSNGNQAFVTDQLLARSGSGIRIGDLNVDTCVEAVRILDKSTVDTNTKMASNPAYNLAAQLLAAKLNILAGARRCPSVLNAIGQAQALLDAVNFTGTGSPTLTAAQAQQANSLADFLDRYNNGLVC